MSFFWENGLQIFYKRSIPPPAAKYHGLINQGATCYLNSVLQVLFMTKDFREAVERHTNETPGPIDHHLKQLFKDLIGHKAYTNNITKTLGIDRVYEQRDAAEYIEKILRLTSPEASQIFHGLLTYKNICSQCHTENDNDERFWHLPLALMDSCGKEDYSVVNGIEAYFRPSVFSGENQMYCEECDAKSDATNKCVIKHHPEVLILLLKRFEFDYSHMTYVKIYCTVDVPHTLQIPENQTYELYAVVDHLGDLRSGHYTATIKDDESWYRFNDDKVTLLDYQPCQVDNSEKFRDAYLLFYRKTNVHAADTEDIGEVSTPGGFPPATSDINEQRQEAGKIREREEVEGASVEDQENEGFVDVRQDISEDLRGTQRTKSTNKKHEQQGKEKMDVKRDKEQNRGDDNGQDVEDQNNEGLDEIRQNQSEQKITDTHSGHKDVCVEKQAKEQDDEHIQNRADSSVRQAGSSGSRSLKENQEVSSVEKTRHGDPQPRGVGRSPEPSFNVEDQDKQVYARNSKPINHLECNEERNDLCYLQDAQAVKQRDEGKIMADDEEDMGGNAEAGKRGPLSRETQLEESVEDRDTDSGRPDDVRQRRPDINHDYKDGKTGNDEQSEKKRSTNKKHEQQGKEKMDVKRDKEQNRGDDNGQDVEDQNNEGLDEIRQNQSEQKITDTHSGHKDVCVEKQAKEQDDEHIQNRADSSVRQAGSSGSRSLTENQEVSSVEKTRHGDPQPRGVGRSPEPSFNVEDQNKQVYARNSKPINHLGKIMTDLNPRTGFNENTIKGRRNPEQSRPGGNVKRKSDPKINAEVTLSESVCNMKRSEETSQEPQKHQTKSFTGNTQEEIETHSTVDPNARTKRKVSDTQEQDAEIKHEKKKRKWWHLPALKKKQRKEKNKHKKPVGCFSFSCKSKNNADPTSESD
ncbi:uncharacterized protein DDB_G0290685-like isoform X1 [Micropterus salmoides]|uniref:uncharacterized protein DDB_G0290685-like isoform X1 n=1 Tax=Micropterus salmoides TaxID=27706 RepID=UPI0018EAFA7E|nr:uncharacterized protein DDB_G0290685-like isoform X1 [Micropterus salmoides]